MNRKPFFQAVLPSLLAFAFSGVYAIVDGLFVGQATGDAGLAAINLAFPITALLLALGTGIGMGGAVQIAISKGKRDTNAEHRFFFHTIALLAITCAVSTAGLLAAADPLLLFFGARGTLFPLAQSYTYPILIGAAFQILATGLVPVVRNYNGAVLAMATMIAGFLTNVLLDWLFIMVFSWGIAGAAIATAISQAVTTLPCIVFLFRHGPRHLPKQLSLRRTGAVLAVGLSPFGLTLAPNLVIVVMNRAALAYGGNDAVSAYAIISYLICIVQLLLQGVGDGCQPLISLQYGARNKSAVRQLLQLAYGFAFFIAFLSMAAFFLLLDPIVSIFGASDQVSQMVVHILPLWIWAFPLYALLRITTSYFYAVKKNAFAYPLIYGEPICMLVLLFLLPQRWNLSGVWYASLVTARVLSLLSAPLLFFQRRQKDVRT